MTITAINVRNQFRGKVREIIEGPVVSEVDVETPAGLIVTSVITTRSIKALGPVVDKDMLGDCGGAAPGAREAAGTGQLQRMAVFGLKPRLLVFRMNKRASLRLPQGRGCLASATITS